MGQSQLSGQKIAILATDGFEQSELLKPQKALTEAGAEVHVVSPQTGFIRGWDHKDWGESVHVDKALNEANADDYQALVLPGGVMNPDSLRNNEEALKFVNQFIAQKKPIAAICHGPQILIETGFLAGKKMTSYWSVKTDMKNAGAEWVDKDVVCENGFITSRCPEDLPAFNKKMIAEFQKLRSSPEVEKEPSRRLPPSPEEPAPSLH